MVQKRALRLSESEVARLKDYRDHDRQPQVRERCAALLKIAEGQSAYQVARTGLLKGRDPDTLYKWLNIYQDAGIEGLRTRLHGGAHRRSP